MPGIWGSNKTNKNMKIIDLLNKIAKGEEIPKKFINKQNHQTYELINYSCYGDEVTNYKDEDGDYLFGPEYKILLLLNDEVEIIEEEKEIEKLDDYFRGEEWFNDIGQERLDNNFDTFASKINELIDVINDMRDRDENND